MPQALNLTGHVYGRLTVLDLAADDPRPGRYWRCQCRCGWIVVVSRSALRAGHTESCKCLHRERAAQLKLSHGLSHTPEHRIWMAMLDRCLNPNARDYKHYGGRGIYPCDRWRNDFMAFWTDKCPRPSPKHELDRIDNNGPYSPENTRWVLRQQQMNNTRLNHRLTFNGRTQTIREWSRETGIPSVRIEQRVNRGHWTVEQALTIPVLSRSAAAKHHPRPRKR